MKTITSFLGIFLAFACSVARAQQMPKPETPRTVTQALDRAITNVEKEFVPAADAMPADKYDFTPSSLGIANFKFNGIRTFAEQVKHVAQQNYDFFSNVGRMKPDVDLDAIANLKTKDEIVAALAASFVYAHKAIGTLTIENASEVVPGPQLATRATTAAHGIAHGYNHHGQLVEYLRMNGIDPPQGPQ